MIPGSSSLIGRALNTSLANVWQPEPARRGTYTLLSSCLITLGLCVWSAVHLNIPAHHRGQSTEKLRWVLCGMFVPEILAVMALLQYLAASQYEREVRDTLGLAESPSITHKLKEKWERVRANPLQKWRDFDLADTLELLLSDGPHYSTKRSDDKDNWTTMHSFYAAMGGYAFDSRAVDPFIHEAATRVFLTPAGVKFLLDHRDSFGKVFPSLTSDQIADKSKVGGFGKALLCLQAGWFCLQSIVRVAKGLPLSLLEVNTIAHAICALLIYCLWWEKPFGVEAPSLVYEGMDICAYMCMCSAFSTRTANFTDLVPEFESINCRAAGYTANMRLDRDPREGPMTDILYWGSNAKEGTSSLINYVKSSEPGSIELKAGHALLSTGFELRGSSLRFNDECRQYHTKRGLRGPKSRQLEQRVNLRAEDIRRWDRASRAMAQFGLPHTRQNMGYVRLSKANDWPTSNGSLFCVDLGGIAFSTMYGAIHAAAWNHDFVSPGEQLFWRASVILMMMVGALPVSVIFPLLVSLGASRKNGIRDGLVCVSGMLGVAFCVLYASARLFLVLESFRDLCYLPDEVYQVPRSVWTSFIPHGV